MPIPLPVSFSASPLPSNFQGTPQNLLDAIVARLQLTAPDQISFFSISSVLPLTNTGPVLLNGQTWYVWDNTTGSYQPEIIESQSLKYIAQQTAPDQTIYTFWIVLDSNGQPTGISYYYNGAWQDIYATQFANYSTTEQINQILAQGTSSFPCGVTIFSGGSPITVNASPQKINFDTVSFDPFSCYDPSLSIYTCQQAGYYQVSSNCQIDGGGLGADPATIEFSYLAVINGNPTNPMNIVAGVSVPSPAGERWYPSLSGLLKLNQGDTIDIWLSASDYGDVGSVNCSNGGLYINLIQKS